jgi:hypothetical protein
MTLHLFTQQFDEFFSCLIGLITTKLNFALLFIHFVEYLLLSFTIGYYRLLSATIGYYRLLSAK